jgi:hypothetical protein
VKDSDIVSGATISVNPVTHSDIFINSDTVYPYIMVKTSKGDTYFKTEVISDPYLEDTIQGTINENGIPIRIHQVQPLGIRNQFLTYSFNNVTVETPIIDQFESLNTALPDHISDNDYRNSIQNPADYDYWNSPNENYDLTVPDWILEQREAADLAESRDRQRLEEFQPSGTINVYWGQAESETSTRILSNLAPRRFTFEGREYGSVEHAYQSNKSGTFDKSTYDAYNNIKDYYEGDIKPGPNTIFVFGSNLEGRHGAGAAKIAREQFGAIYGQGEGLQGNAYALPTKDLRVKENRGFKSISPEQITESIKKLYEVARQNPDKQFKVAYRNTTKTSLSGYTGLEMIEMFNQAGKIPPNIVFSKE